MRKKEWIQNIQDRDHETIELLISELYPQIYSYVYVRMKGKDCSKDITQEVFLRFIRNIDRFDFPLNLKRKEFYPHKYSVY